MPKAMRWQVLAFLAIFAVIAILIGVAFAGPLRGGLSYAAGWLGFGHDHDDELVAVTDDSGQVQYYTCGMHPWVILPNPGDCPICFMDLTPIDPNKFTGEIAIDPVIVQNMGVRVAPVVTGPLTKTIRTVGTIDYNERAVRDVNIKTPGWIEELHVDFVGAKVEAGEPLFELYSPQLYAAQEEYLLALKNEGQVGSDLSPDAGRGATNLLEAARTRLEYFDITEQQVQALRESGEPTKTMTIESPHTGVVIAKHANEGMKVDPGMQAYRIADLSTVWALVTLYEYQLPYVVQGMKATMTLPYIPGQTFEGEVIYIYPYLDKKTREVQVRLEFDNKAGLLKPGMFVNVELENTLAAEKTLAPRSAIIDTGERQVAFVSRGEGKFEPRDVRLGVETGDGMVEIISGLKPGEMVVTSGQFLIDSESKIREALAKMIKGDLASEQKVEAQVAGASALGELPTPVAAGLTDALGHYFALGNLLADDSAGGVDTAAAALQSELEALEETAIPDDPHFWHKTDSYTAAVDATQSLAEATDLASARQAYAALSVAIADLLKTTGVPPRVETPVDQLVCGMYDGPGDGLWLQPGNLDVRNPFQGTGMLTCNVSSKRQRLPITGGTPSAPAKPSTPATPNAASPPDADPARASQEQEPETKTEPVPYPIDFCLVSGEPLGSMGKPVEVIHGGRVLKFCCEACISAFQEDPDEYLDKLDEAAATLGKTHGGH
jgi:RND family efflux transporter MFP subunit